MRSKFDCSYLGRNDGELKLGMALLWTVQGTMVVRMTLPFLKALEVQMSPEQRNNAVVFVQLDGRFEYIG